MKKIGSAIYIHKSATNQLSNQEFLMVNEAKNILAEHIDFEFTMIKVDKGLGTVSFIYSPDFDSAKEPIVGDSIKVNLQLRNIIKVRQKKNPQIYHRKHLFVNDDYAGFDIEEQKAWCDKYDSILPTGKGYSTRIGYKSFWDNLLKENGLLED